ncbi:class I SAM-dependent methyltransferase [Fictibacillus iocasae]|uniref:Class I SAM-dependent methyltransferase n=1 Tax=Fictibacillus iocasae TaxID=2715437 RepID=A0ABW2NQT1_9BACL
MNGEEFDDLVHFFDSMARTSWLSAVHDTIKEETGSWEGKKVLDVGCGTGRLLLKGAEEAEAVTGVDLSREMVKSAVQNFFFHDKSKKAEFLIGDACALPVDNSSFHLALSTCVIFLLPEPELGLKELHRVLKADGTAAMLNPSPKMNQLSAHQYGKEKGISGFELTSLLKWANVSTRRHRYSEDELTSLLTSTGFHTIRHVHVLNGLATITLAVKSSSL